MGIQFKENKQQYRKGPHGRTAVAEKRQRNSDYDHQTNGHSDIDQKVKKQNTGYAIPVRTGKPRTLSFGQKNDAAHESQNKQNHSGASYKTVLFANGTKNKIGVLFRNKVEFGLGAV